MPYLSTLNFLDYHYIMISQESVTSTETAASQDQLLEGHERGQSECELDEQLLSSSSTSEESDTSTDSDGNKDIDQEKELDSTEQEELGKVSRNFFHYFRAGCNFSIASLKFWYSRMEMNMLLSTFLCLLKEKCNIEHAVSFAMKMLNFKHQ